MTGFRGDLERERQRRRVAIDDRTPTGVDVTDRELAAVDSTEPDRSIDGAARPPAEWENENSAQAALAHLERQEAEHRRVLRDRAARPPAQRLRDVLALIGTFQSAGAIQHTHARARGAEQQRIGPAGGDHTDLAYASRMEVDRHLLAIVRHVEALEGLADTHLGRGVPADVTLMSKADKDRFILAECVGLRPEDVTELHPSLGKPPTIRKLRSEAGLRGVDGRPKAA